MDFKRLEGIGLTRAEAAAYGALCRLGPSTTGPLAAASGVHSSKIYVALDKLVEKGLVAWHLENKIKRFRALPPNRLIDFIDRKRASLESELAWVRAWSAQKPISLSSAESVEVYSGYGGMLTLFDEVRSLIPAGELLLAFSVGDEFRDERANRFFKQENKRRLARKLSVKIIAPVEQREFELEHYSKLKGYKFKFASQRLPCGTMIFGDRVAMISWQGEPKAFVVTSKQFAGYYRDFFNDLWKKL
ncbi:hypothetical protein AUJ14_00035 [Candidatus Micrarchaeota archaeon CG1_02_55_22]|nr:MAG: hypothetical protein AUJ14_00035 [Candidatus Micrarchaeota archaeon CG1_02_55_22]